VVVGTLNLPGIVIDKRKPITTPERRLVSLVRMSWSSDYISANNALAAEW
jgi:hypothetical protein